MLKVLGPMPFYFSDQLNASFQLTCDLIGWKSEDDQLTPWLHKMVEVLKCSIIYKTLPEPPNAMGLVWA